MKEKFRKWLCGILSFTIVVTLLITPQKVCAKENFLSEDCIDYKRGANLYDADGNVNAYYYELEDGGYIIFNSNFDEIIEYSISSDNTGFKTDNEKNSIISVHLIIMKRVKKTK